jgi:hypothetical protein
VAVLKLTAYQDIVSVLREEFLHSKVKV